MTTSPFDWANVTKQELKGVDEQGNYKPIQPGVYETEITNIEQKKYDTGTFALIITYSITSGGSEQGRDVKEPLYLVKKDGTANEYAQTKLKLRMMQAGLTSDEINNFKGPKHEKGLGDFEKMLGAKVRIETSLEEMKEGKGAGRMKTIVSKVTRIAEAA